MEPSIEQAPEDDWVDQDLLTKALAGELLEREIAAELDILNRREPASSLIRSPADTLRRLDAMRASLQRLRSQQAVRPGIPRRSDGDGAARPSSGRGNLRGTAD